MNEEPAAPPFQVKELGEVAIRCSNLEQMESFYHTVIGLPYLSEPEGGVAFFRIADGFEGHPQVLALFQNTAGRPELHEISDLPPVTGGRSSFHHLALSVSRDEQDAAIEWFKQTGLEVQVQIFDWIGWRGVFVKDPEGNTVELVANDPARWKIQN